MTKVSTEQILLGIFVVYGLFTFPLNFFLATVVVSLVAYLMTKSFTAVLGIFVAAAFIRVLNYTLAPTTVSSPVEAFQVKDPMSIHQRVKTNTGPQPLSPGSRCSVG